MTEKEGNYSIQNEITIPDRYKIITHRKVNCYLIKINGKYLLIDSGYSNQRKKIEKELDEAGCEPGNLKLILLTHGDFDHSGNCTYFRDKYGAKIAIHENDAGMVKYGDMFWNRTVNPIMKIIAKIAVFILRMNLKKSDRFKADIFLEEGQDFSEYGFDAKVIHLPGHSKGSIGFLTKNGDLFCGDLLINRKKPKKNSLVDVQEKYNASIKRLKKLNIKTIYPGHGQPFTIESFNKNID
ncbi:MAG: MBL fold metallo-hydrolase [Candidatus Heimdallarchaeota archaeon]|nr:MBL fold metallo-hydrolase [Candidatus Heimdallarchaeota archaeon]